MLYGDLRSAQAPDTPLTINHAKSVLPVTVAKNWLKVL